MKNINEIKPFPVRLRNRLILTGIEPVLSLTEKQYLDYRHFSTNIKIKTVKLTPVLSSITGLDHIFVCLLSAKSCLQYDAINN